MIDHIGDFAELYALGSLDDAERAQVERHAATCATCAQRVSEAEEIVAGIAQEMPRHEPPARLERRLKHALRNERAASQIRWFPAALAAAVLLAIVPVWFALNPARTASVAMRQDEEALARIAAAPFARADFTSAQQRPMNAKVLYGKRGDWYYVIVMHPKPGMQVAYVHDGKMEMLGKVAMHGESGSLYLPVNHKMQELALLEDGAVVAHAYLAY